MRRGFPNRGRRPHERGIDDLGSVERRIGALARRQHSVVDREQLLAMGLGPGAIDHRVRAGRMSVIHRGVYLVGHAEPTWRALEMAAILATGPGGVLSHRSATRFWSMLPYPAQSSAVTIAVTVRGGDRRSKPGIRVHRTRTLMRRDYVVRDEIPVTTPARTILDLAAVAPRDEVEAALSEALVRRLVSERQLEEQLERNAGRKGSGLLRMLIDDGGLALTRSEAERRMLRLVRAAGLPAPETNARIGGFEVDLLWREHRLVVEVDGHRFHSSRSRFERDRERDAGLAALGYTVIRVTWRQIVREPEAVVARLAAALAHRRATARPLAGTGAAGE